MPSWTSRLEVQVGTNGGSPVTLSPITSFTTTFGSAVTPIHSIEADNVGVIIKPKTMAFTMTIPAIGPGATPNAAILYNLAIAGQPFDVALTVSSGNDWVFKQLLFRNCFITAANPSNVTIGTTSGQLDTTPVATFSGICTDFVSPADITTP